MANWFWRPLVRPQGLDRKSEMVDDVLLSSLTMIVLSARLDRGADVKLSSASPARSPSVAELSRM